jgi:hypothetical protein
MDVCADFERQEIEFGKACLDMMAALVDAGCPRVFKSTPHETPSIFTEMWQKAVDEQWDEGEYNEEEEAEQAELEALHGGDAADADDDGQLSEAAGEVDTEDSG